MTHPGSSYVCDTIPPPRFATVPADRSTLYRPPPSSPVSNNLSTVFEPTVLLGDGLDTNSKNEGESTHGNRTHTQIPLPQQPPPRKLCVRHQRMADEGMNLKLQHVLSSQYCMAFTLSDNKKSLDALPEEERQVVNSVWSNFSSSSHARRALILQGILTMCCFSQLSLLTEQLTHLIRIDPFVVLPREISLRILSYLDATSLCRAAQVARRWKALADDDILWRGICEQHIGQRCKKCGWGLPILEKNRTFRLRSRSPCSSPLLDLSSFSASPSPAPSASLPKRSYGKEFMNYSSRPVKRSRSERSLNQNTYDTGVDVPIASSSSPEPHPIELLEPTAVNQSPSTTRPWKSVYSERMTVERNWRRGRCTTRTLKGHTDGVMCLQFNETLSHPSFPVLITGSYDCTARVWNLETGAELHCLKGHTRAVRSLQFDEVKLITGSMDSTIKIWDWRRGRCIRTLTGHTEGVVCLNYDASVLASGSMDSSIRVWNFRSGGAFTLHGHSDWVNAVQLWDSDPSVQTQPYDLAEAHRTLLNAQTTSPPQVNSGKMLFSASDDGSIRLWDLNLRVCVRQFNGHVGQVQSLKLLPAEDMGDGRVDHNGVDETKIQQADDSAVPPHGAGSSPKRKGPLLISGCLDNTIKVWDIETGKAMRTLFGHIEGVWSVACDKLRLVSGSHDRTIKVWSRDEGRCTATLVGHQAAVSCIALGEDKIVSGSDDWDIKVWNFSD